MTARAGTLAALLLALPAAAKAPGWERWLDAIAPALRACLADRPGAMVVEGLPMNRGLALALIRQADGGFEECVADIGTARVESRRPAGPPAGGPALRAFMLERRCADARRVVDGEGREMGWLAYPGCG